MPTIYLSPSTQEFNPYVNGGNEEYYMNLIADAMIPYLNATGINYVRNETEMNASENIAASNSGNYDLHLALHSNASFDGTRRGSEVYYYPKSPDSQRAAEIFANNLKLIYPIPQDVKTVATTILGEVARTKAPAVLIEYAYHDNLADAQWIENNIEKIAENTVLSIADYFGIPFRIPESDTFGTVMTPMGGNLNIRESPTLESAVIGSIPSGSSVKVLATLPDWYLVRYGNIIGYSYAPYINEKNS